MAKKLSLYYRDAEHPLGLHAQHLRAIAERLDVSEVEAVYLAVARLYAQLFGPKDFDFPNDAALAALQRRQREAKVGRIVRVRSLTDYWTKRPTPRRRRRKDWGPP